MHGETIEDYLWALQAWKRAMKGGSSPAVISTGQEQAFKVSIRTVFPAANILICRWNINKNLQSITKKYSPFSKIGWLCSERGTSCATRQQN
jgi:hypothetical protein